MSPAPGRPANPDHPSGPLKVTADFLIDVDLVTGDAVVRPLRGSAGASGALNDGMISGRYYGTASQIAYRFFDVQPPSVLPDGRKLFTLPLRLENLLPHRVGTLQQSGAVSNPPGIYIYVSLLPFVTAGCAPTTAGCSGSVHNPDGHGSFSAVNQPFWYFPQHLEANDGAPNSGPDLSVARAFQFAAGAEVTNMTFGVSVKAPWAVAGESYTVSWNSLWNPLDGSVGPQWTTQGSGSHTMLTGAANCGGEPQCLQFQTTTNSTLRLYRSDPLSPSQSAFIEGTALSISIPNGNNPTGLLGMWDGVKYIQVGVSRQFIGFTNLSSSTLLEPKVRQDVPTQPVTFRISKNTATGMVHLHVNNMTTPFLSRAWADFPDYVPAVSGPPPTFWFGNQGQPSTTRWSNVSYGVGTATP